MVGHNDDEFVQVAEREGSDDIMELPIEKDGTVLLSTIQAQFPSSIGLKYKSSSGGWRGIRAADNILDPPSSGWGETVYYITVSESSKRRAQSDDEEDVAEKSGKSGFHTQDIVIFGLPYTTTDDELKEYFTSSCGELAYHEIKLDRDTKKSRGFAFIRFTTQEGQTAALNGNHEIDGRKLTVRLSKKKENPMKLFIGRLRSGTTREQVTEYFQEFGDLSDVFVPVPFRGFGFITYESEKDGMRVSRMSHILNGANLNVTIANPIEDNRSRRDGRDADYRSDRRRDRSRSNERSRDRSERNGYSSYDRKSSHSSRDSSRYDPRHSDSESRSLNNVDKEDLKKMLVALLDK